MRTGLQVDVRATECQSSLGGTCEEGRWGSE